MSEMVGNWGFKQIRRGRQRERHLKMQLRVSAVISQLFKVKLFLHSNYPRIKLQPALLRLEDKIEHLSSYAHVVHTTVKQVISRRGKSENVCEMYKNENTRAKRAELLFFIVKYANL